MRAPTRSRTGAKPRECCFSVLLEQRLFHRPSSAEAAAVEEIRPQAPTYLLLAKSFNWWRLAPPRRTNLPYYLPTNLVGPSAAASQENSAWRQRPSPPFQPSPTRA